MQHDEHLHPLRRDEDPCLDEYLLSESDKSLCHSFVVEDVQAQAEQSLLSLYGFAPDEVSTGSAYDVTGLVLPYSAILEAGCTSFEARMNNLQSLMILEDSNLHLTDITFCGPSMPAAWPMTDCGWLPASFTPDNNGQIMSSTGSEHLTSAASAGERGFTTEAAKQDPEQIPVCNVCHMTFRRKCDLT